MGSPPKGMDLTNDSFVFIAQGSPNALSLVLGQSHSEKTICLPPTYPQEHFLTQKSGQTQERESSNYFNKHKLSTNNVSGILLGT